MRKRNRGFKVAENFEEKLEDLDLLDFKDLTEITQFFKTSTKFLQDYRVAQARGDLAEKNKLARQVSRFKEFLLKGMDRIEEKLKMDESAIDTYVQKEGEFDDEEKAFLELVHQELRKALYKPSVAPGNPVAKMKQGKTKMRDWMRP